MITFVKINSLKKPLPLNHIEKIRKISERKMVLCAFNFIPFEYSVGTFLLYTDSQRKQICPKALMVPIVNITADVNYISDINRLSVRKSKYILVKPSPLEFDAYSKLLLKRLVQNYKLTPIIFESEKYLDLYEENDINYLFSYNTLIYHFSQKAINDKNVKELIIKLIKEGKKYFICETIDPKNRLSVSNICKNEKFFDSSAIFSDRIKMSFTNR